jgi:hypothetical protein
MTDMHDHDDDGSEEDSENAEFQLDSSCLLVVQEQRLVVSSVVSKKEVSTLLQLIDSSIDLPVLKHQVVVVSLPMEQLPPGATGRAAILQLFLQGGTVDQDDARSSSGAEDDSMLQLLEEWKASICQDMDEIAYQQYKEEEELRQLSQPVLLSITATAAAQKLDTDLHECQKQLISLIDVQCQDYGLVDSVESNHEHSKKASGRDDETCVTSSVQPSLSYEVDGAWVSEEDETESASSPTTKIWDTSSILVFDNLLPPKLRGRLLDVVLGRVGNFITPATTVTWDDDTNGPDPARWQDGGLTDLPPDIVMMGDDPNSDQANARSTTKSFSFGLTDVALMELCACAPPPLAIQELERILVGLFPDFVVSRLPEAVLGANVTPLTANAPCSGQSFNYHIDADPFSAPPSPWTDVFGRYANRARGKPRFMSCLLYLNEEWNVKDWGAPTRFLDVATETVVDVSPKPGRVVLLDQDITHTVVAPFEVAGKRPRYSLVWKLILHPKKHHQDMRQLRTDWPKPILVGSANMV